MACFPTDFNTVYLGPCGKCGNYHGSWQPCIVGACITEQFNCVSVDIKPVSTIVLCDTCGTPMTVTKKYITSTTTGGEQEMYFYHCPKCQA